MWQKIRNGVDTEICRHSMGMVDSTVFRRMAPVRLAMQIRQAAVNGVGRALIPGPKRGQWNDSGGF